MQNMPEQLRNAVEEYLKNHDESKLLTTNIRKSAPYKDKTIISSTYCAYLEWWNLLTVLSITKCSKEEWSDNEVRESCMIAGDIQVFLDRSNWFKM